MQIVVVVAYALFLSTLSLRRATPPRVIREPTTSGFLSTLSLRRATFEYMQVGTGILFLSTLSLRRATWNNRPAIVHTWKFLSTLSLRRATILIALSIPPTKFLSTLSLRRATRLTYQLNAKRAFLSTLSLRRATAFRQFQPALHGNFYPRSPCGERPSKLAKTSWTEKISIHALLAESDDGRNANLRSHRNFYPRSPCGERHDGLIASANFCHFYPRSPCGERPYATTTTICTARFLSTLSLRRATVAPVLAVGRA